MSNFIKKQLIKHLGDFCEGLDLNSLHLSLAKGDLHLQTLKLKADALHAVLNVPTWLEISNAIVHNCRVAIPGPLKLTKTPIKISFTEVKLDLKICDPPRPPNGPSPFEKVESQTDGTIKDEDSTPGSYGFIHKIIEGISFTIESVEATLQSKAIHALITLGPIEVFSSDWDWNVISDLKQSRIYDPKKTQVLNFKVINCQMLRLEATASRQSSVNNWAITPLKLMMTQTELRLTLRRRTKDCMQLCTKIQVIFEDLLWLLTDGQTKAALLCAKTIKDAMKKSTVQAQKLGVVTDRAVETDEANKTLASYIAESGQQGENLLSSIKNFSTSQKPIIEQFRRLCPQETSMHARFRRVEFHLFEDKVVASPEQPIFKSVAPNGGTQIILESIRIDHYPARKAAISRKGFEGYSSSMRDRDTWVEKVLAQFRQDFQLLKQQYTMTEQQHRPQNNAKVSKLYESVYLIHITNIEVYPVSWAELVKGDYPNSRFSILKIDK